MYRKFHNLRVRFAELEITQNEAAKRAGMPASTLTNRMTGRYPFTAREINALSKVLDIKQEEICKFFLEDTPAKKGA